MPFGVYLEYIMAVTVDLTANIIDVRDIIERIGEIAHDLTTYSAEAFAYPELVEEHAALCAIMRELAGNGGDEQWEGEWYPLTLIRDHHFTDYCRELCEDIGAVPRDLPAYIAIDWDETAQNLMVDYSSVEIPCNNRWVSYFYR
jgi:hypothetical protein